MSSPTVNDVGNVHHFDSLPSQSDTVQEIELADFEISPSNSVTSVQNVPLEGEPLPQPGRFGWIADLVPTNLQFDLSYGVKLYLVSMLFGTLMTASAKYAMLDCNHYAVSLLRMIFTFIPSIVWLRYHKVDGMFWGTPGLRTLLFTRAFVGSLDLLAMYYAVQYLPLPDHSVLTFLIPLVTAAAAYVVLDESYHWTQAISSIVSLCGVVVMTRQRFLFAHGRKLPEGVTDFQYATAIAAVMGQVVGTTCVFLLLRKIAGRLSPQTIMANYSLQAGFLSVLGIVEECAMGFEVKWPTKPSTWVALVIVSGIGYIYQYLLTLAVTAERAGALTQFDYLQIILSSTWQYLIFHTLPDYISVLGGILILSGVWAANKSKPKTA